jgi:hypothetical protein
MSRPKATLALFFMCATGVLFFAVRRPQEKAATVVIAVKEEPSAPAARRPIVVATAPVLEGSVRSREGEPVAGARVCAADAPSDALGKPRTACTTADSNGAYAIALSASGAYTVSAEAEGFKPGSAQGGQLVAVAWGERRAGLEIILDHGGAKVAGVVVDVTGGPISGAIVRGTRFAPPRSTVATVSDREGRFVLWVLAGDVSLNAEAAGYAPTGLARVAPAEGVVIALTPGSSVRGNVMSSADEKPVADVEVRAVPARGTNTPLDRSGVSDTKGAFTIAGLEPGVYTLSAEGSGWRGGAKEPLKVGLAESVSNVIVTVSQVPRVDGRVILRATGEPCAMGMVSLGPPGHASLYDPPSVSDERPGRAAVPAMMTAIEADGSVHFRAVPAGIYHATVQCAHHMLADGPTTLQVAETSIKDVVWKVDPGLALTVHMVDEADNPLPGALVLLGTPRIAASVPLEADASGQCEVPRVLYPGIYRLTPAGRGYEGDPVSVVLREGSGKVEATVRFAGHGSIMATVQNARSEPIEDMRVTATLVAAAALSGSNSGGVDADVPSGRVFGGVSLGRGRFRLGPLPPGRYEVHASDGVNEPIRAGGPSGVFDVDRGVVAAMITVDRSGSIRGVVVDQSHQPVPDTWVSAQCQETAVDPIWARTLAGRPKQTMSDKEGRFVVKDLRADARCTVRAEQPFGLAGGKSDVSAGDDIVVALTEVAESPARTAPGAGPALQRGPAQR